MCLRFSILFELQLLIKSSNFLKGFKTIFNWHVKVEEYQIIVSFIVFTYTFSAGNDINCLLAIICYIDIINIMKLLQSCFNNKQLESVVIGYEHPKFSFRIFFQNLFALDYLGVCLAFAWLNYLTHMFSDRLWRLYVRFFF